MLDLRHTAYEGQQGQVFILHTIKRKIDLSGTSLDGFSLGDVENIDKCAAPRLNSPSAEHKALLNWAGPA